MSVHTASSPWSVVLWITVAALVLIGGPVGLFLAGAEGEFGLDSDAAVAEAITGTWAWIDRSCDDAPQTISFSADLDEMYIAIPGSEQTDGDDVAVTTYSIVHFTANGVRGEIHGETRLTDAGEAVVWDLVLQSTSRFVWHRTDWARGAYTRPLVRCD